MSMQWSSSHALEDATGHRRPSQPVIVEFWRHFRPDRLFGGSRLEGHALFVVVKKIRDFWCGRTVRPHELPFFVDSRPPKHELWVHHCIRLLGPTDVHNGESSGNSAHDDREWAGLVTGDRA